MGEEKKQKQKKTAGLNHNNETQREKLCAGSLTVISIENKINKLSSSSD